MNWGVLALVMLGGALGALLRHLLGALTTFSALMIESLLYARSGRLALYSGYLALTLAAGFLLVWLGARLGQVLRP